MDALGEARSYSTHAGLGDQTELHRAILEYAYSMEETTRGEFLTAVTEDQALCGEVCEAMAQMARLFAAAFAIDDPGVFEDEADTFLARCWQDTPMVRRLREFYFENYAQVDLATDADAPEQRRMVQRILAARQTYMRFSTDEQRQG